MATVARIFRYDIVIHQGVDEYFPLKIIDSAGNVPDLSGWTSTHTVYPAPATLDSLHDASPVDITATVTLGLIDGGDFGDYNGLLSFPAAESSNASLRPWGTGIHILDLIDPYGHVQYRVRGTATMEEGTRHG